MSKFIDFLLCIWVIIFIGSLTGLAFVFPFPCNIIFLSAVYGGLYWVYKGAV